MVQEHSRNSRIAALLKRQLSVFIQREFPYTPFGMLTISYVDVSHDLANAKIFFTTLGSTLSAKEIRAELQAEASRCRHYIARSTVLRRTPNLSFHFDASVDRGQHISSLIDSLACDITPHTDTSSKIRR